MVSLTLHEPNVHAGHTAGSRFHTPDLSHNFAEKKNK